MSAPRITLCGSTRFRDQFWQAYRDLTLYGWIVLAPGAYGHVETDNRVKIAIENNKAFLDKLHKEKIFLSDAIMVIDVNGYVGESTKTEIEYAKTLGLPVYSFTKSRLPALEYYA